MTRVLGRRVAQITLAGAVAATPLVLGGGVAQATDWDAIAQCESSGNWSTSTGNGFSGGLQFTPSTWKAFGGSGSAKNASREEQIAVAERVKAEQGMNAWPTCSKKTGNTSDAANGGSSSKSTAKKSSDSSSSGSSSASSSSGSSSSGSSSSGSSSASSSKSKGSTKPTEAPKQKPSSSSVAPAGSYTVVKGDTLSSIAAAHGVDGGAAGIASRNGIANPDVISVGQQLALR